jgi:hypothetical protein
VPERDAALRILGEPGWRLLLEAGAALDATPGGDALAAASALAARRPDAAPADRAAALELVTEGQRLATKLGVDERLLAVRGAVEQATPARVATWHALQLPENARILEIGCGCGADTLALAHRAANLIATDVDPVRAACTHMNLMAFGIGTARAIPGDGFEVLEEDGKRADVVFVDPDRRPGGRRTLDTEEWRPPLSAVRALTGGERHVFVKAAPSLDPEAAPELDVSYVSHGGECLEAFLSAAPGVRARPQSIRAVLLPDAGPSIELAGDRGDAPAGELGEALYVPDPAAVRARLLAELARRHALVLVDDGIAWLSGPSGTGSPWLTEHAVRERVRLHPTDVRAALKRLPGGFGALRVHCKAVAFTAPQLEKEMRRVSPTRGAPAVDLFATRVGGAPTALLTQRV